MTFDMPTIGHFPHLLDLVLLQSHHTGASRPVESRARHHRAGNDSRQATLNSVAISTCGRDCGGRHSPMDGCSLIRFLVGACLFAAFDLPQFMVSAKERPIDPIQENAPDLVLDDLLGSFEEHCQTIDRILSKERLDPGEDLVLQKNFEALSKQDPIRAISFVAEREKGEEYPPGYSSYVLECAAYYHPARVWSHISIQKNLRLKSGFPNDPNFDRESLIRTVIRGMPFPFLETRRDDFEKMEEPFRTAALHTCETRMNTLAASLNPQDLMSPPLFMVGRVGKTLSVCNVPMKPPAIPAPIFDADGKAVSEGAVAIGVFLKDPALLIANGDLKGFKTAFKQFGFTVPLKLNHLPGLYCAPVTATTQDTVFNDARAYTVVGDASTIAESENFIVFAHDFELTDPDRHEALLGVDGKLLLGKQMKGAIHDREFEGFQLSPLPKRT